MPLSICTGFALLSLVLTPTAVVALPVSEARQAIADWLVAEQGPNGAWPGEADFTGSIVAGMACAYEVKHDQKYLASAELGGDYILWVSAGNFFGDEAFALTRLSELAENPSDNPWRTAVKQFYSDVKQVNGTEAYISQFVGVEPSTAVFYLANHVVAAYYVDAEDKQIWRQALVDWLAQVDDSLDFPVMGLGVATWALALTGELDNTLIDPSGTGASYWGTKNLADLPGLILSHQVPNGEPYSGSFYWRFDHGNGGSGSEIGGYTEDAIFATLGLVAAAQADPNLDLDAAVLAARQALLGGIDFQGKVYEHLWLQKVTHYFYAGEMLQVLCELIIPGDLDLNGSVDFGDFVTLADSWCLSDCARRSSCNGADIDRNGQVDAVESMLLIWKFWPGIGLKVQANKP